MARLLRLAIFTTPFVLSEQATTRFQTGSRECVDKWECNPVFELLPTWRSTGHNHYCPGKSIAEATSTSFSPVILPAPWYRVLTPIPNLLYIFGSPEKEEMYAHVAQSVDTRGGWQCRRQRRNSQYHNRRYVGRTQT